MLALTFGTFAGSAATTSGTPYDIYLRLDGIDGESTLKGYERWIVLSSAQISVSNERIVSGGGSGAGKASAGPLVITKAPDAASVKLFLATASGTYIKKGVVAFVKRGEAPATVLSYELGDILITSYSADNAFEKLELSFSSILLGYSSQNAKGGANPPVTGGWSFDSNKKL
ncbi:MAG: type VI secretion system tube protein Hcp [Cohnella sp.]|nr:type VI secretion system tube protein Hcp [Cohnella sp.]